VEPSIQTIRIDDLLPLLGQRMGAGGSTPGAPSLPGPGLITRVSDQDLSRYIPGYAPTAPSDYSALLALGQRDPFAAFADQPAGGGGRGAGAGGERGGQGALGSANQLLNGAFQGGGAQMDPNIMAQIQQLMGASAGQYGQMPGLIGGADDPILRLLLGELGAAGSGLPGGGGGGFAYGGGSVGGGLSSPDIALKAISPEAQALINQMTAASKGGLALSREEGSGQALADLFGRGVARSSIALDKMGRLQYGHEQALQQADAAGAQQTLAAMLADQQARTELGKARLGAEASLGAANAAAGASGYAASQGAAVDAMRARLGTLADIFGSRSSALASAFGAQQGANTGFAGVLSDSGRAQLGADSDRLNTAQSFVDSANRLRAAMHDADQQYRGTMGAARIGQQTELANLPFQNSLAVAGLQQQESARIQDALLKLLGLDLDRYGMDTAAKAQLDAARASRPREPSTMDKILGVLGGAAGMFSFGF
jgi:hypothetical protein